eukprot:COSAG06_NODE_238_length_19422_cov_16.417741_25_plen_86_part_00
MVVRPKLKCCVEPRGLLQESTLALTQGGSSSTNRRQRVGFHQATGTATTGVSSARPGTCEPPPQCGNIAPAVMIRVNQLKRYQLH